MIVDMKVTSAVNELRDRVMQICSAAGPRGQRRACDEIAACVDGLNSEFIYRFALGLYDNPRLQNLELLAEALDVFEQRSAA